MWLEDAEGDEAALLRSHSVFPAGPCLTPTHSLLIPKLAVALSQSHAAHFSSLALLAIHCGSEEPTVYRDRADALSSFTGLAGSLLTAVTVEMKGSVIIIVP